MPRYHRPIGIGIGIGGGSSEGRRPDEPSGPRLVDVPAPLVERLARGVAEAVRMLPGDDLVAVVLVYCGCYPGEAEPEPFEVAGCSRARRAEILRQEPPPGGLVYAWSNLEFDAALEPAGYRHFLGPWREVNELAQRIYAGSGAVDDDGLDETLVPRSALIAACRHLNERGWDPRPDPIAGDAVVYPAAHGGVDPDTTDNLKASLSGEQLRRLGDAALLPPW